MSPSIRAAPPAACTARASSARPAFSAAAPFCTGTGAGGISEAEKDAVRRASAGADPVVFVRSSRVGNGRVIARKEYDELGMIPADNLNPQKARILLMLALTHTSDRQELRRIFSEY